MVAAEDRGMKNGMGSLSHQFQIEKLNEPGYVKVYWKGDEKPNTRGFIFHVGEFSLPILRSRPYQRNHNRVERNVLRPWLMGRVMYKKKVLLENPGRPGIILQGIPNHHNLVGTEHNDKDNLLSTLVWIDSEWKYFNKDTLLSSAVWMNGKPVRFKKLSLDKGSVYIKQRTYWTNMVVTTTPILEQTFQINNLRIVMEIILSSDGPVQRMSAEILKGSSLELNYCFLSLFPKNVTEYYGHDNYNRPFWGKIGYPSGGSGTARIAIPRAQWLAVYNPTTQLATLVYSPDFKQEKMDHLLIMDHRQDFRVCHIVGDCEHLIDTRGQSRLTGLTVNPGHPQQLSLFVRPIEATPEEWKTKAEEKASQLACC